MRIGFGYDVHKLVSGRKLILGGVFIPSELGLLGHSDADVLTHSVMDALLGAAALGDIGKHFPDTDPAYSGADSMLLLKKVCLLLADNGFSVNNIAEKLKDDSYEFVNGKTKRKIGLEKMKTIGNSGEIDTIYVNSRKSDAYLRIYNKQKQGLSNKKSGYYTQAKNTKDWIRVEGEFKHREAHRIGNDLAQLVDSSKMHSYLVDCITRHWILTIKDKKDDGEKEGA